MIQVTVSASALQELLQALNGPPHIIRELIATRGLGAFNVKNPIDTLCDEYNAAVEQHNKRLSDWQREQLVAKGKADGKSTPS